MTFGCDSKLTQIQSQVFWDCDVLKWICIPSSVEVLCSKCFQGCSSISSLTFQSNSKLTRIESQAFQGCSALQFICIPQGTQGLEKDWHLRSSLARVLFQSSVSLQKMIEQEAVDLKGQFDIDLVDWDGIM
jgi:hypothetical protein